MNLEIGQIVCSRAGHDNGWFYAVVSFDGKFAYICDGRYRPLEHPKKKNPLHLAPTTMSLPKSSMETNHELRKSLARFNKAK